MAVAFSSLLSSVPLDKLLLFFKMKKNCIFALKHHIHAQTFQIQPAFYPAAHNY